MKNVPDMSKEELEIACRSMKAATGLGFTVERTQGVTINGIYTEGTPKALVSKSVPTEEQGQKIYELGQKGWFNAAPRGKQYPGEAPGGDKLLVVHSVADNFLAQRKPTPLLKPR